MRCQCSGIPADYLWTIAIYDRVICARPSGSGLYASAFVAHRRAAPNPCYAKATQSFRPCGNDPSREGLRRVSAVALSPASARRFRVRRFAQLLLPPNTRTALLRPHGRRTSQSLTRSARGKSRTAPLVSAAFTKGLRPPRTKGSASLARASPSSGTIAPLRNPATVPRAALRISVVGP